MQTQYNDPKGAIGATKTPLGLIPPYAMEQTSWVHKLGSEKYGSHNWRKTGVCASTYVNAILRHLNAWRDGEDLDPESGISHIAHVACCCNILLDAEYCGKLQDDRNKRPTNDETEKGSLAVGEPLTVSEFANLLKWIRGEDEDLEVADCDLKEEPVDPEYRILKEDERLRTGDEVYVGEGHWSPVYYEYWQTPAYVNNGTYRRKITDCDLKEEPEDLGECTCGRRYIYHWLYGWICEDCDIKYPDPYNS